MEIFRTLRSLDKHILKLNGNSMKKIILITLTLLIFSISQSESANLYVRPTAAGTGSGTDWANAAGFTTMTFVRGNTYYFAGDIYTYGGTYAGRMFNEAVSGTSVITIKKAGAVECALANAPAGCNNQAVFTELLNAAGKKTILHVMTSYWVFDGVTGSGSDISSYGFKVTPSNCDGTLYGTYLVATPSSVNNVSPTDITISHVAAINCGSAYDVTQGGFMPSPAANQSNIVYSNNYVEGGNTNMIFSKCVSGCVADGNYLSANWSSSTNHGAQFVFKGSPNLIIKNNYFKNSCVFVLDGHVTGCTVEIATPYPTVTGVTASRLTDTTQTWTADQWNGKQVCKTSSSTGGVLACFIVTATGSNYVDVSPATLITDGVVVGNYYTIMTCNAKSDNVSVYNNIVDTNPVTCPATTIPGVFANGDSAYADVMPNFKVYGNTFYNLAIGGKGLVFTGRHTNPSEKAIVRNNLIYSSSNPGRISGVAPDTDYNAFFDCTGTIYTETNGQTGTGNPFVNVAGGNFHLAIRTLSGKVLASPYQIDRDGKTRGLDCIWDRGAYQY